MLLSLFLLTQNLETKVLKGNHILKRTQNYSFPLPQCNFYPTQGLLIIYSLTFFSFFSSKDQTAFSLVVNFASFWKMLSPSRQQNAVLSWFPETIGFLSAINVELIPYFESCYQCLEMTY